MTENGTMLDNETRRALRRRVEPMSEPLTVERNYDEVEAGWFKQTEQANGTTVGGD